MDERLNYEEENAERVAQAVVDYWDCHDVAYLPGVSDAEIAAFEQAHEVVLPVDMRVFYGTTNGTRVPLSAGQDHESFDFYRLDEVVRDDDFPPMWNFADYRELSWWYAVDLEGSDANVPGSIYLLGAIGRTPIPIADSFVEFLALYLSNDLRLVPMGATAYRQLRGR